MHPVDDVQAVKLNKVRNIRRDERQVIYLGDGCNLIIHESGRFTQAHQPGTLTSVPLSRGFIIRKHRKLRDNPALPMYINIIPTP